MSQEKRRSSLSIFILPLYMEVVSVSRSKLLNVYASSRISALPSPSLTRNWRYPPSPRFWLGILPRSRLFEKLRQNGVFFRHRGQFKLIGPARLSQMTIFSHYASLLFGGNFKPVHLKLFWGTSHLFFEYFDKIAVINTVTYHRGKLTDVDIRIAA